jgi:hypothetical protein
MDMNTLLGMEIVSRGKLRDTHASASVEKVNGQDIIIQTRKVQDIQVTPAVWDALLANADFKARFDVLTATRSTKREEKLRAEREAREAEFIANAKVFKAIA